MDVAFTACGQVKPGSDGCQMVASFDQGLQQATRWQPSGITVIHLSIDDDVML